MKILCATYMDFPLEVGGFQNQVREIVSNLIKCGVEVSWYNIENTKLNDYDILQVFSSDVSLLPIVVKAKSLNLPVVMTPMVGSRETSNLNWKTHLILSKIPAVFSMYKLRNRIIKTCDYWTPLSEFESNRLQTVFGAPRKKIKIIPNGINDVFFSEKEKSVSVPFDNYVLIIGRIEKNKNQLNLIKAVSQLQLNLVIVGEPGIYGAEYYDECLKVSGKNVHYWGVEKDVETIKGLYKKASLTVIPSYSEMVPLVIFESLAMKTPVVCTKYCSITGAKIKGLSFTGVTVKELIHTLSNKEVWNTKEISKTGIYSWNDIANEYYKLYETIIKEKK